MKLNALKRLTAKSWQDESEISFKATGEAQFLIPKLLRILAFLGSAGASRTITIEDVPGESEGRWEEGDIQFGFDGDGADKITDIMIDGKEYSLDDAYPLGEKVQASKRRVFAGDVLMDEAGFDISTGGNSFKCHSPADAYQKAVKVINQVEHDGFKYTKRGAMSHKMDVWRKGTNEISISVHDSILNIDLW